MQTPTLDATVQNTSSPHITPAIHERRALMPYPCEQIPWLDGSLYLKRPVKGRSLRPPAHSPSSSSPLYSLTAPFTVSLRSHQLEFTMRREAAFRIVVLASTFHPTTFLSASRVSPPTRRALIRLCASNLTYRCHSRVLGSGDDRGAMVSMPLHLFTPDRYL